MRSPKRQQGVALVLIMMVTALVAAISIDFFYDYKINMARVGNRWGNDQAQQYLLGAENLAALVMEQDAENGLEQDNLNEDWAQEIPPLPTDHGFLEARMEDAQARFNINSMKTKVQLDLNQPVANEWERFTPAQRRFIRLVQTFADEEGREDNDELEIAEYEAIALTEAIIDWLDDDDDPTGFGGAESLYYSDFDPVYRPANQFMNSVSELRMVRHMTPALYTALEPYLIALPAETDLNVNTAPLKLLRTINNEQDLQPLAADEVEDLITDRELQPFESIGSFMENDVVQRLLTSPAETNAKLGVSSSFFILHAKTSIGEEHIRYLDSLLYRNNDGEVSVFNRRYTSY